MAVRSITKRWLFNSFGIIVVIMVAMVIGVSAAMHSFYYNSVSQYINNRAEALSPGWRPMPPMPVPIFPPGFIRWCRILSIRTALS